MPQALIKEPGVHVLRDEMLPDVLQNYFRRGTMKEVQVFGQPPILAIYLEDGAQLGLAFNTTLHQKPIYGPIVLLQKGIITKYRRFLSDEASNIIKSWFD